MSVPTAWWCASGVRTAAAPLRYGHNPDILVARLRDADRPDLKKIPRECGFPRDIFVSLVEED